MEKKITKKEYFGMIRDIIAESDFTNKEELLGFIDKEVERLDTKAEKSKERNAKKKAEGDALKQEIQNLLTDEFQTAEALTLAVQTIEGYEMTTKAKVIPRLTALVNDGIAEKQQIKVNNSRLMGYKAV